MNTKDIAVHIAQSFAPCVTCGEFIDAWPVADPSEPGMRVIYVARHALFVGVCSHAHINEFYLPEAKAEEYVAHDVTERTLGTFTPQSECKHKSHTFAQIPSGQAAPGIDGLIVGPATVKFCYDCGFRKVHEKKEAS